MGRQRGTPVASCTGMLRLGLALSLVACHLGGTDRSQGGDDDDGGGSGSDPTGDGGSSTASGVTCTDATGISGIAKVIECVPAGMEGKTGTAAPLVVALHGFTQTADEFEATSEWQKLAAR